MGIMALQTVGSAKRLPLMRLNESGVFDIVAVETKSRYALGEMLVKLDLAYFADFVCRVTGVASHVEGGVAAAFFGNIQPLGVAIQA